MHILSSFCDNMFLNPALLATFQALQCSSDALRVYIELLSIGSQPASTIARKAGLKRGHTYNLLTTLQERGLVQEVTHRGIRFFSAAHPQTLVTILQGKQEQLDHEKRSLLSVIPELERIKNPLVVRPRVRFFQGSEGIKEIYEETLSVPHAIIYAVGDFQHFFPAEQDPELNRWLWRYSERRAKKGIWYYGILNQSSVSDEAYRTRVKHRRKLKMLQGVDLPVEVNIVGSKVAIISTSKDMVGLILDDQPTADTLRNFHQAIWSNLEDYSMKRRR